MAREQFEVASAKIDKTIQEVLGMSDESGGSSIEYALQFAFVAGGIAVAAAIWPI